MRETSSSEGRGGLPAAADGPARRGKLHPGTLGEGLHPELFEGGEGASQLLARVAPASAHAEPLTVEQPRPGEVGTQRRTREPVDGLAVPVLGLVSVAQQGAGSRLDAERPVASARSGHVLQAIERLVGCGRPATAHRRLDQFDQSPVAEAADVRVTRGRGRGFAGGVVAPQPVVEHGRRPLDEHQGGAFAPAFRVRQRRRDQRPRLGFPPPDGGEPQGRVRRRRAAGRLLEGTRLGRQRLGLREPSGDQAGAAACVEGDGQRRQCAGGPADLQQPPREELPGLEVPQQAGRVAGQPVPAQHVLVPRIRSAQGVERRPQRRHAEVVSLEDERAEPVQQEIARARTSGGRRRPGHLGQRPRVAEPAGEQRRAQHLEIHLASMAGV